MTVFWLVLATALMLYGRFGTDKIASDSLRDVAVNASNVAMLACLGMAFFSLFDPPNRSSPSVTGPGGDFWSTLGGLAVVLIGLCVVGMMVAHLFRRRRWSRDELTTSELALLLDRTADRVMVTIRGSLSAYPVAVGRLILEITPYDTESEKRAHLIIRQWPGSRSLSPDTAVKGIAEVVRIDAYIHTAKEIRGWLNRHPGVEFDAEATRLSWARTVDAMVRHARAQGYGGSKPAIECCIPYDGPSLDYLVIGTDGKVFAGIGEQTSVKPVTRPLVSDGGRRLQVAVGEHFPTFSLNDRQVATLRKMRLKGLVDVVEGRF